MSSSQWKSAWVSRSSPARSCSLMTTASASWNFSRKRTSIMQVSSGRPHMLTSNQRGRGQEPVTVLGRVRFLVAVNMGRHRYDADEAFRVVLPHLLALKARGARTFVDCTPAWLGRDPALLVRLSEASGLHIVTNTGYYGAAEDKYLPAHAFEESAEKLAERWTAEWRDGIEGTGVRPGFIKTGVDPGPLSAIDRKLIVAASLCHRQTGLRIHCHTGDGRAAMDILSVLDAQRISPAAFVWVHAQNEKDRALHLRAARAGAWIELDGVAEDSLDAHVSAVVDLARAGQLGRVLLSQDAGWYRVGEPAG